MPPRVLIVMAVFRPDPEHLGGQMRSLAAQSHRDIRLICVIADTVSGEVTAEAAHAAGLQAELVTPERELDAVRAFEAGLAAALEQLEATEDLDTLVALCDQDDIWHPERLARGISALEKSGADLVHGDARLVTGDGALLHPSMFAFERRHKRPGLRGLLYRNTVTGMTLLMRRRVAEIALPFPPQSGVHFYHDLWLGLIAAATGGVHLIDAPLVDYRQHGRNAHGAVDRQAGWPRGLSGRLRRIDAMWLRREAASYALARYLAHATHTRIMEAVSDGRLRHDEARLAPLRPFLRRVRGTGAILRDALRLGATGKAGLARIAGGFAAVGLGRTIWALREALGPGLSEALESFDTRLYSLSPGMSPQKPALGNATARKPVDFTDLIDTRKEPGWIPAFTAEAPAVCVLVPTLNPTEIFAGVVTAIDIGLGLAARGLRVRFIATDLPVSSLDASRRFVLRRLDRAAAGAEDRIGLHCGVRGGTVPAHRGDRFLATAWWSAHAADRLIRAHGFAQARFAYLIQDFEPGFYPWGPEYADAAASYELDFLPVFNTTLLRDYFAGQGFGFAGPQALAFHPAIDVARYAGGVRPPHAGPRRLALYGRPEVPRNMYATAIEALARFVEAEGLGSKEIELVSVGLRHAPVSLPGGLTLNSLGKLPWEDYPGFLLETDLGLSLMHSPHPSHPPIEMAASGVRVVTNGFGPKTLSALSPAILSAPPDTPALAAALSRAWAMGPVADSDRRIDLTRLGLPPEALIDRLARQMAPQTALAEG